MASRFPANGTTTSLNTVTSNRRLGFAVSKSWRGARAPASTSGHCRAPSARRPKVISADARVLLFLRPRSRFSPASASARCPAHQDEIYDIVVGRRFQAYDQHRRRPDCARTSAVRRCLRRTRQRRVRLRQKNPSTGIRSRSGDSLPPAQRVPIFRVAPGCSRAETFTGKIRHGPIASRKCAVLRLGAGVRFWRALCGGWVG